jgi:hypothetical protein
VTDASKVLKSDHHALGLDLCDFGYVMEASASVRSLGHFSQKSVTLAFERVIVQDLR